MKTFINWLFRHSDKQPPIIEALVTEETVKTIQINYNNQTVWLQKSLLKLNPHEGKTVTITIPLWLYTKKFNGQK